MTDKSCSTGLDDRCRDANGEIRRKNGNTRPAWILTNPINEQVLELDKKERRKGQEGGRNGG